MSKINLDGLSESEGLDLFTSLKVKFGWAGTVTTRGDVTVRREDEETWWDSTEVLTDAMWDVVRETYEWTDGIEDAAAAAGNEIAPQVTVLPNGNFIVEGDIDGAIEYTADGEEVED